MRYVGLQPLKTYHSVSIAKQSRFKFVKYSKAHQFQIVFIVIYIPLVVTFKCSERATYLKAI